ncbi:MAG: FliA/WhiG family RNA polymerase sigma factor [Anaerolineae bacterium]|nr:FliA/WhiG family RNA polymerase sigma factor [Anaerolineae bacterium]
MAEQTKTEAELVDQYYKTHEPALREAVILHFIPLVHFVLGRLGISRSTSDDYDDLQSQGVMGLIEAVDHFKPEMGNKLSTYATFKIRGRILDYLRSMDWLSRSARQKVRAVQDATNDMQRSLNRLPTDEELAQHMQINVDELQQIQQDSSHTVVSLDVDDDMDADEGGSSLHERLMDDRQENPSESYEHKDNHQNMANLIKNLSEKEQMVLSLYYYEELTFKEIGKTLDISESRVCQIHGRAMLNLKTMMKSTGNGP